MPRAGFLGPIVALLGVFVSGWLRRTVSGDRIEPNVSATLIPGRRGERASEIVVTVVNPGPVDVQLLDIDVLVPRDVPLTARGGTGGARIVNAAGPQGPGVLELLFLVNASSGRLGRGRLRVAYTFSDDPDVIVEAAVPLLAAKPRFWEPDTH